MEQFDMSGATLLAFAVLRGGKTRVHISWPWFPSVKIQEVNAHLVSIQGDVITVS
jgi:hypothetical protein